MSGDGGTHEEELIHLGKPDALKPATAADHAKLVFPFYVIKAGQVTVPGIAEVRRLRMEHVLLAEADGMTVELREETHQDVMSLFGPELPEHLRQRVHTIASAIFDAQA